MQKKILFALSVLMLIGLFAVPAQAAAKPTALVPQEESVTEYGRRNYYRRRRPPPPPPPRWYRRPPPPPRYHYYYGGPIYYYR